VFFGPGYGSKKKVTALVCFYNTLQKNVEAKKNFFSKKGGIRTWVACDPVGIKGIGYGYIC
jgi:hypothetical protein